MNILQTLRSAAAELTAVCALAALMELVVRKDGEALGFRALCGLAVAVCALRCVARVIG